MDWTLTSARAPQAHDSRRSLWTGLGDAVTRAVPTEVRKLLGGFQEDGGRQSINGQPQTDGIWGNWTGLDGSIHHAAFE